MKPFVKHILSKDFFKNLGLGIGIAFLILLILMIFLRSYTRHGQANALPNFSNMSLTQVDSTVQEEKLRYEIFDSLFVAEKAPGVVIDQHPEPGFLVKKNRKVYLTINAQGPDKIQMPDLVGITLIEARPRLSSSGLKLGKLSYRYDMTQNVVLDQMLHGEKIEPGDTLVKGTAIDLVLSKGLGNQKALIPDLIGLSVEEAEEKATNALFSIGSIVPDMSVNPETDTIPPKVFRQRPNATADSRAALGSSIIIWITQDSTKLPQPEIHDTAYVWPNLDNEEANINHTVEPEPAELDN